MPTIHMTINYALSLDSSPIAIFGRVGRIASEEVVIHLIVTKCLPVLLYGLEACQLRKSDLNSLDFVVNRFFMKLFQTSNIDIVKCCQSHFCFDLPSVVHDKRARKFDLRYRDHSNPFCRMISHLWMLWVWYFLFLFRYCRYCRCSLLIFS